VVTGKDAKEDLSKESGGDSHIILGKPWGDWKEGRPAE
jgi:hypothetical protein